MRKNKYNNLDKEFLYNEHWINKKSLDKIARDNNIASGSMNYIFKKFNIFIRTLSESNKLINSKGFDENKVIDLYINDQKTMKEIAELIGSCASNIYKILKRNNIKTRKGHIAWNKGLDKNDPRVIAKSKKQAKTLKELYSSGKFKAWNDGLTIKTSEKVRLLNSKRLKNTIYKRGKENPCYGKPLSKEHRIKLSLAKGGTGISGEKSEYGYEFDSSLKEKARFRDQYKCKICGCSQLENGQMLSIHHIDYNKLNNNINNLVSLCRGCHSSTNIKRNYWTKYFNSLLGYEQVRLHAVK